MADAGAPCGRCGAPSPPLAEGALSAAGLLVRCLQCGGEHLYRQRDFNQRLGLAIVGVAALLAPFTWYLSLVAAAVLDFALYKISRDVVICYRRECRAQFRGLVPDPRIQGFDLATHDYFRSLPPRQTPEPPSD